MFFSYEDKQYAFSARRSRTYAPAPHVHTHIEIIAIKGNGSTVATADGVDVPVGDGDLFISFPNQIHYYNDTNRPIGGYLLIISPDMCPEFSRLFKGFKPKSPLVRGALKNERIMNAIDELCAIDSSHDEYSEAEARGYVLVLLGEIFKNLELEEVDRKTDNPVKDVIKYCYDNYTGDISLKTIAEALHISPYYISHIFNGRLHISLNDYINSLRIAKACDLLKAGNDTVTEISYAVGYNSPRTFNRCFMKLKNKTPKEYRDNARN